MKYTYFEPFMVGKSVVEISTGDKGVVDSAYLGDDNRVYVNWTSGHCAGFRLHTVLEDLEFVDHNLTAKLDAIERLLSEVKQLLKEVDDTV